MSTNYPGAIDTLSNPTGGNYLDDGGGNHSDQHANANDAIEAIETKLGTGSSTAAAGKVLRGTGAGAGASAWGQVDPTTDIATFTSAQLKALLTDETGSGAAVFASSPTIVTPTIASIANANHNHADSAGGGQLGPGALVFSGCTAYRSSVQTISSATFTAITFDAESYDTYSYHSTSSNTSASQSRPPSNTVLLIRHHL